MFAGLVENLKNEASTRTIIRGPHEDIPMALLSAYSRYEVHNEGISRIPRTKICSRTRAVIKCSFIALLRRSLQRRILSCAVVFNLILWPGLGVFTRDLIGFSASMSNVVETRLLSSSYEAYSIKRLLSRSAQVPRHDGPADRVAAVAQLRLSPGRLVAYLDQTVVFNALPTDSLDRTVQGVPLMWESSNPDKIQIDDSGRATCLRPGLARITCRAGAVSATAPMFVRPIRRPVQSDAEWRTDQSFLRPDGTLRGMNGSGPSDWIASLVDRLSPTALAQSYVNNDFPYDELWSDPANLVGSPRNRVMDSSRLGTVLPESNNFNMAIPIVSLGGRGVGASLTLYYNTRVWFKHGSAITFDAIESRPSPGFSLGFGRLVTYGASNALKYLWIDADGTRHYLGQGGSASQDVTLHSNDGSHLTYVGNAAYYGALYGNDGSGMSISVVNNRMLPSRITDSNGNYITIAYKLTACDPNCSPCSGCDPIYPTLMLDYVTDTMGRVIQCNYNSNLNLVSITAPGFGGTAQNPVTTTVAQFDYENRSVSNSFSGLTVENLPVQWADFIKHIYMPATQTGYTFTYSAFGMIYNVSSRRQMSINQGVISDGVESNSVVFNYPQSGTLSDVPTFTQRTESATNAPTSNYNYSSSTNGFTQTRLFTITRPDNSTLNLARSTNVALVANGLLTQTEIKTSGGASMAKSVISYANDPGGQPQVANVVSYDDGTPSPNQTKVDIDYDSYGNVTNTRAYGFQVSGQWKVRRRSHSVYKTDTSYVNAYLRNLVIESDLYDALLDTNDANDLLIAKTTFTYDDYAAMGGMEDYRDAQGNLPPPPPGHDAGYNATYTVRGNVTGTTQWYDLTNNLSYTRLRKIDVFGATVKEQLACCNEQTQTATQTYYWSLPEYITKGTAGGAQLTMGKVYDFNTGLTETTTDPNGLTTTTAPDAALRPTLVTTPTGATSSVSYNDATLSVTGSKIYDDNGTQRNVTTTTDYDGWGRVIHQTNRHGGQVNTTYDAMGRAASVSNPFTAGGTPGLTTGYTYDVLGRTTLVTLPDNQTLQTIYNGNSVITIDQVNRKTQRLTDGFGRLITVNEQDASGFLTQATNYSYDVLGNLTQVNQGNQLRTYKYDALSRMTNEKIPEQGNPTQPNQWTTTYTYTSSGAVATRTDARGVIAIYGYDTLNRVSQVSYNTVSGVTTAPTVTYVYDTDPIYGTTKEGAVVRINVGSDYQERYTFDQYKRITSTIRTIGSQTYMTSDNYNQAGQPLQTAFGTYQYDSVGRLSSIAGASGNGMNNVSYNIAGQITGDTLTSSGWNNGYLINSATVETFGYDANRKQLTSQTAVTTNTNAGSCIPSCPPPPTGGTNLSLNYSYQASAGQMGVGTTPGNAGQLMSVSGTIGGLTESASYTYDNYARLVTSNQTSNGSSAQRRFAYDRWGNRSGVWDATSGGNQIQSISLQTVSFPGTGSAPTNRVTSITSGSTLNYSYDANGNVTNDGLHIYTYDSENRVISVDNGAVYAYDCQNRRYKKTVGGNLTHYGWEGNQVVREYNGANGTMLVSYSYAGSRLIGRAGGSTQVFLSDRLSARLALTDVGVVAGRQGHLPFGEDFAEAGTQEKHHFTGYERDDEGGTDYAINRQYSQTIGRFNRCDDEDNRSQIAIPRTWNRYSYVLNNPINFTDPSGLLLASPDFEPCADIYVDGIPFGTIGQCGDGNGWGFDFGGGSGGDPAPSPCNITVRTGGKKHSTIDTRTDINSVNYDELGKHETGASDGWWFFIFEVEVSGVGGGAGWTFNQSVVRNTNLVVDLGGILTPVHSHFEDPHDGGVAESLTFSQWNGNLYNWIDEPARRKIHSFGGSIPDAPVVSATVSWSFVMTATNIRDPRRSCSVSFELTLNVGSKVKWTDTGG
jgi:RHS repeat-associated protein